MKSFYLLACLLFGSSLLFLDGCRSTPVTGRQQLLLMPETQEVELGLKSYQEVLSQQPLSANQHYQQMVKRVGQRIAAVSGRPDYQWEFEVIASPEQNAFCLPGGKVAVYEGIMPVCQNEAGLAVVMSHEIAHALARHGGERMSHQMAIEQSRQILSQAADQRAEHERELLLQTYGAGTKYGIALPYQRHHETEADRIGLMLMARAGYDPAEAPRFWQRFASSAGNEQPAEFLSTHPADWRRIRDLESLQGEAAGLYAQATTQYGLGEQFLASKSSPVLLATPPTTPVSGSAAAESGWQTRQR